MSSSAAHDLRPPSPGDLASGHGVVGKVAFVPDSQPLAQQHVWRVTLVGEAFGRLVSAAPNGTWFLLQLDDLSEAQQDALDEASVR